MTLGNLAATYNGAAKSASPTTSPAGLTVSLTYNGSSTAPTAAGTYAVVATVNDANYAGTASGILVIAKASQTITFAAISNQTLGAPPLNLFATASSGLGVGFVVVSGPATLSGSQLTISGLGEVIIEASQSGNANWQPAATVRRTFRVDAGDFAQGYVWAKGYGASGFDTAYAIAADASGNAFLFGDFESSVTIGSSTLTASGGSLSDTVLVKLTKAGAVAWSRQFGGVNSDFAKTAVALPGGGVVAGGEFLTSTTISGTALTSAGSKDIVLVNVDATGTTVWAKRFGGTGSDSLHAMAVDASGNLYLAGQFSSSITFGSTTLTSSGGSDGFLAKLDSSGTPVWARKMGGTGNDITYSVAVSATGEIAVAGSFNVGATFGSITLTSAGGTDAFAASLDASGVFLWAKRFGGTTADNARGLAFDTSGGLWVTGSFTGSAASGFGSSDFVSAGAEDIFVVRLALADASILEANRYGGTGSDTALVIAADPFGTMLLAGSFQNSAAFGSTTLTAAGLSDAFVAKLRAGAGVVWALRGGGANNDLGQSIAINSSGEIFQAGIFDTTATFGTQTVSGGGFWDMFVAKINGPVPAFTSLLSDLTVDEGDSFTLSADMLGATPVTLQWFQDGVAITGATASTYAVSSATPSNGGVYTLQATNAYGTSSTVPVTVTVRTPDQILSVEPPATTAENRAIDVPVYLDSLGDVTGLSFVVSYNKDYLAKPTFASGPKLANNTQVVIDQNAGTVRVVGTTFPSSFSEGRQLVGTIRFTTRSVPPAARVALTPTLLSISNVFGQPIEGYTKLKGGSMAIAQRDMPGDANNNGRLDVADAAELIRLYANPAQIRSWDHALNDLNLDTILTEGDATKVLRVVTRLDEAPSFPAASPTVQSLATGAPSVRTFSKTFSLSATRSFTVYSVPATPAARLVLTQLTGANANKVLAQVYLDGVAAGQAGLSFQVDYPAALLRIPGASSLVVPAGALPAGVSPTWNVAPGNVYASQTGRVSFAAAWAASHTFPTGSAVANIVFEIQPAATSQVRFPLTLSAVEVASYSADGPASPTTLTGQTVLYTRSYADWALATLGNSSAATSADADGDGQTNQAEFLASTNPADGQSLFKTTFAGYGQTGFTLRWFAAYGVAYQVQVSTDLATWSPLAGADVVGTGAEVTIVDSTPIGGRRFFRVVILP